MMIGPFETQEAAVAKFREVHPFKGAAWMAKMKKYSIMTGYGSDGPRFDIRWHDPK